MNKSKKPCMQPGCPNLVDYGYCLEHKPKDTDIDKEQVRINAINSLRSLDYKKDPKTKKFYTSRPWIKTSVLFRKKNPLCQRCEKKGIIKASQMVHHRIEVRKLWEDKKNPLSWRYLEALCNNCHLEDLRDKKQKYKKKYKY